MFRSISIVFVCLILSVCNANAQVNIETGLFINQPGLDNNNEMFGMALRGGIDEDNPNLGMSLRVGRFLFGIETLTNFNNSHSMSMTSFDGSGEAVSAGFTSTVGPTHRAMMGFKVSRNIAVYGFHGLAGYSIDHELSYNSSREEAGTYQEPKTIYERKKYTYGCGYSYYRTESRTILETRDFTATHSSVGYSSANFDGFRNSIGAGVEAGLLGGVLRLEYNMMHTSGFTQTAKLNHSTTDERLPFSGEQDTYSYRWNGSTEQKLQFRWKTSF